MTELLYFNAGLARVQRPAGKGPHPVVVMLHGLTGDEDVMWIFAGRLPKNALLIAPRGLFPVAGGGFGWQQNPLADKDAGENGFDAGVDFLTDLLIRDNFPDGSVERIGLVGFSQGAALAYTFALAHPERVTALAGLAGYLPRSAQLLAQGHPLVGQTVFMAHGTQDAIVPFDKALEAKGVFETAGARVVLCTDDVGHKLSANCFRGLETYFQTAGDLLSRKD